MINAFNRQLKKKKKHHLQEEPKENVAWKQRGNWFWDNQKPPPHKGVPSRQFFTQTEKTQEKIKSHKQTVRETQ